MLFLPNDAGRDDEVAMAIAATRDKCVRSGRQLTDCNIEDRLR
jgi:hypothetical protein